MCRHIFPLWKISLCLLDREHIIRPAPSQKGRWPLAAIVGSSTPVSYSEISIFIICPFCEFSEAKFPKTLDTVGIQPTVSSVRFLWSYWSDLNWRPAHYECAALPLSHSSKSIMDLTVNYNSTFFSRRQSPTVSFLCLLLYYLLYIPVLSPLYQSRSASPERTYLSFLLKFLFGISSKRLLFLRL